MARKIYLAGPDVFLEDAKAIAEQKRAICARHGFEGRFPLDGDLDLKGLSKREAGFAIFRANRQMMDDCDLVIANMTPFRGPSMDVGTAFEIGYMAGRGKPVLGYTNVTALFADRTRAFLGPDLTHRPSDGQPADANHMAIEDFDQVDNLMLESAIVEAGFDVVRTAVPADRLYRDLQGFEACVEQAAKRQK